MRSRTHINTNPSRMGFTLIEVLIAVLILALGLLGLGAVFPVVITQQRMAVAVVDGESVASMAEAILRDTSETIDFSEWFNPASDFGKDEDSVQTYEWIVGPLDPYNNYLTRPGFVNDNGGPSYDGSQDGFWYTNLNTLDVAPTVSAELNMALSVADRLIPQPYSGKDPKYVWDIVARRQPGTDRPQLAIFVRLIDARIHVPKDRSLSDVLVFKAAPTTANSPSLPVALDKNTGRPAVDNAGDDSDNIVYAAMQALQVQVVEDHLDWLIFEDADNFMFDTSISFATRPGQKLLDNTGTVRTVLGPPPNDSNIGLLRDPTVRIVRIDPPFNPKQAVDDADAYDELANNPAIGDANLDAKLASWVRQIVFTPRTPLAVRVITLEEKSP